MTAKELFETRWPNRVYRAPKESYKIPVQRKRTAPKKSYTPTGFEGGEAMYFRNHNDMCRGEK